MLCPPSQSSLLAKSRNLFSTEASLGLVMAVVGSFMLTLIQLFLLVHMASNFLVGALCAACVHLLLS